MVRVEVANHLSGYSSGGMRVRDADRLVDCRNLENARTFFRICIVCTRETSVPPLEDPSMFSSIREPLSSCLVFFCVYPEWGPQRHYNRIPVLYIRM